MEAGDEIITFDTYYDPMLAHIVRGRLEDNGIACFIADENTLVMNPLYNNALGGIKLKVFARDADKCREILAQDDTQFVEEQAQVEEEETYPILNCPNCKSAQVNYNDVPRKRFGLTGLINTLFGKKAWHCNTCGKDFE